MSLSPRKKALKLASLAIVEAVGGYEAAANFCRLGKSRLQRVCDTRNPANESDFIPVDVALDLEALGETSPGWPHLTRMLAKAQGFTLFREPVVEPDHGDWHEQMGGLADHGAGITTGLCAALRSDRRVTADEIKEFGLIEQVDDLIADAVKLRAMLVAVTDG